MFTVFKEKPVVIESLEIEGNGLDARIVLSAQRSDSEDFLCALHRFLESYALHHHYAITIHQDHCHEHEELRGLENELHHLFVHVGEEATSAQ